MSRKGLLWRGELAQRIQAYLEGSETSDELLDWALDHPFFDDQAELDSIEKSLIGMALGRILQNSALEAQSTRTTEEQLDEAMRMLWGQSGTSYE